MRCSPSHSARHNGPMGRTKAGPDDRSITSGSDFLQLDIGDVPPGGRSQWLAERFRLAIADGCTRSRGNPPSGWDPGPGSHAVRVPHGSNTYAPLAHPPNELVNVGNVVIWPPRWRRFGCPQPRAARGRGGWARVSSRAGPGPPAPLAQGIAKALGGAASALRAGSGSSSRGEARNGWLSWNDGPVGGQRSGMLSRRRLLRPRTLSSMRTIARRVGHS